MNCKTMEYEQALAFDTMFYPGVLQEKDASQYWYVCAVDNQSVIGAVAIDPQKSPAYLKSIAVSPAFQRQGVATALLQYCCDMLGQNQVKRLTMEALLTEEQWTMVAPMVEGAGFLPYSDTAPYYQTTVGEIRKAPYLEKLLQQPLDQWIMPLSQVSGTILHPFYEMLHQTKLVSPEIFQDCDPAMSYVAVEQGRLVACCLLAEDGQDGVESVWAYQQKDSKKRPLLMLCMAKAIKDLGPKYQDDTPVWSLCLNQASDRFLQSLWPNVTASSQLRTYHCATTTQTLLERDNIAAGSATQDAEDFCPTLDEGMDMVCAQCSHCIPGKLLSCQQYTQKPGNVIYGDSCPVFLQK